MLATRGVQLNARALTSQDSLCLHDALHVIHSLPQVPDYRAPLLEGFVASVGGLDPSLAQAAADSVVAFIGLQDLQDTAGVADQGDDMALLSDLAACLVDVWQRNTR